MKAPWRALIITAAVFGVHLGLLWWSAGGGPLIGFAVHHDDFRNLSYASLSDLPSLAVRPVSTAVLGFLSVSGERTYYVALHVLVVAYVTLVVCFMLRLFPQQGGTGALLVLASIVGALSFDHVPEYVFYSGLVTNLVSATTGLAALLLLDRDASGTRARLGVVCGTALFAASLLAKEDFAAAVFVALALRAIEQGRLRRGRGYGAWLVLAVLATATGLFLAWSLGPGRASFLRSAADTYRPDFTPVSLVRTTLAYLTCSAGASFATGVQLAALTIVLLAGRATTARRSLGILAVTLALVAPYAALPRHFHPYYAFNWSVWQAASLLALGPVLEGAPRKWKRVAAAGLALVLAAWVAATHPRRAEVARWYAHEAGRNRVTVAALRDLGETLRPWRTVGVAGAGPLNPWFGHDGWYFKSRLGLYNQWVVFGGPDYLERTRGLLGTLRLGAIEVMPLTELPRSPHPVLAIGADGMPRLTIPSSVRPDPFDPTRPTLVARPDTLRVCDGSGLGVTTLEWDSPRPVEIRVDSPEGPVFTGFTAGGRAETGKWVRDGTTFFLRDQGGRVEATVVVRVTTQGCP